MTTKKKRQTNENYVKMTTPKHDAETSTFTRVAKSREIFNISNARTPTMERCPSSVKVVHVIADGPFPSSFPENSVKTDPSVRSFSSNRQTPKKFVKSRPTRGLCRGGDCTTNVEVATVPQNPEKSLASQMPTPLEPPKEEYKPETDPYQPENSSKLTNAEKIP